MADNAAAFAKLDAQVAFLRKLPQINHDAAAEVAQEFQAKVENNVSSQVDPYGHPWRPSPDGLPLLVNAAKQVTMKAKGTEITMELTGVEVRHHVGSARGYHGGSSKKGGFRRPIIPFSKLPGPFLAIIRRVLSKRFDKLKAAA
jgi:hypothetical protein